jgi:hypothetical protein
MFFVLVLFNSGNQLIAKINIVNIENSVGKCPEYFSILVLKPIILKLKTCPE